MTKQFFNCLRLSRDDFKNDGYDASNLSDQDMQEIADIIGDNCMDMFWYTIQDIANDRNIPKLK